MEPRGVDLCDAENVKSIKLSTNDQVRFTITLSWRKVEGC